MQGSIPRKIGRLTAHLLRHPRYIRRCLSHHPLNRRSPLDFEIPWFSYAAIRLSKHFPAAYLKAIPKQSLDVIVLDGSEEWTQVRPICFAYAEKHIRQGGVI